MTRSATPENEAYLLQVARQGTAQHVEKLVRKFERVKRLTDPEHARRQHEARELSWYYDDDGMLVFKGRLPMEEGAAFVNTLQALLAGSDTTAAALHQAPHAENVPAETSDERAVPTHAQKRADALVATADVAMKALTTGVRPITSADKYQVVIHIDAERVKHVPAETRDPADCACTPAHAACTLESEGCHFPLAASVVRRLACDASLVTVLQDAAGNVLNIGRKTRSIPPSIRRALTLRDHGCRFPGCCETRFVDAHHIQHWCDGGETSLDNLVLLCRYHHQLLHRENIEIVKGATGELEVVRADGSKLASALVPQFTQAAEPFDGHLCLEEESAALGLSIDARTAVTLWQGELMDYGFAVGTLMDIQTACH